MSVINPFGQPVRLRLRRRHDPQQAFAATPQQGNIGRVALAADGADLSEMALVEAIINQATTPEANRERQLALNALNDRMRAFGDLLHGRTSLSHSALFPNQQTQGVPTAVQLTDADREMVDLRWTQLFQMQDRRGQNNPYFKLVDLYHAIEFKRYLQGQQIEFGFVEAAQVIFEAFIYGAGLQWIEIWEMWQDLWTSAQGLAAMQVKFAKLLAKTAYQILTASGVDTTNYDTTGTSTLEKDINTILNGLLDIKTAIYDDTAPKSGAKTEEKIEDTQTFYVLYNSHTQGYRRRIRNALEARITMPNDNFSVSEVDFPVVPIGDPDIPTGHWYLVHPGRKNVFANFMDLRFYNVRDPRVAGVQQGEVAWAAHRFVRGDSKQVRRLALS